MSLRAAGNKILVEQFTPDDSKGLIHIPEQHQEQTWWCKVVSIGGRAGSLVAVGDVVLIKAHHGMILEHEDRTYRSIEMEHIIGRLA